MQSYHRRTEYTFEEKKIILQEIIKHKAYNGLRGNAFWQDLEARKILQRTWQSLKEHFRKKIIDAIHTFDIPDKQKRLIKEGWESSRVVKEDRNGRKVKRPRYNSFSDEEIVKSSKDKLENYNIINDESDSSTSSINSRRKRIHKTRNTNDKQRRSPSEFNVFSDEEDILPDVLIRKNLVDDSSSQCDSPDLLNNNSNKTGNVKKTSEKPSSSKQVAEPSTSGLNLRKKDKSIDSIVVDSDSDNTTVVESDKMRKTNNKDTSVNEGGSSSSIDEEISLEEDLLLMNFIRLDKTYLQRRKQIDIYNYFHDIYPKTKSPKRLKKRFLKHIFPNICKYNTLTHDEMIKFYEDAGVDIPDNLISLLQESNITNNKRNTDKIKQKNLQINVCEHEISRSVLNCIYCHITLNGQSHIFVSDANEKINREKLFELLSKKFNVDREYIHYTDFVSYFLLEQVNKFRDSIYKQYENVITQNLQDNCKNINVEEVISKLEVCIQAFSSDEDNCSKDSDEDESSLIISHQNINTQEFNPPENSTPEREEKVNAENESLNNLNLEIKQENLYLDQSFEDDNEEMVSNDYVLEIKDEPFSDSIITADISCCHENTEISSDEDNRQFQEMCSKDGDDSQYLESVSTQKSTAIRNIITEMGNDTINVNNSIEIPMSSETLFHTAAGFSQDLK